jgi:hypothetical protein
MYFSALEKLALTSCDRQKDKEEGKMRYKETENLTEDQFLRLTGVKKTVFRKMLAVL